MDLDELISRELNIDVKFVRLVSKRSVHYYRQYVIPKVRGGTRKIFHPSPVLKTFQYWLVRNVFNLLPVSAYASAYLKGSSIKKNAEMHLGNYHILRTDIKDFFPSIGPDHITEVLSVNNSLLERKLGISFNDLDFKLILGLTLYKNSLTIGGVSSPAISNVVMFSVDRELRDIAEKYNCIFTRYADDMVFSSKLYIDASIIDEIANAVSQKGFRLNGKKTFFASNKNKRIVTGIILNSGRLTIGRRKVDKIKKLVYDYCIHGVGNLNVVKGYLSYLKDIDPHCYGRLIVKYQKYGDINDLLIGKNLKEIKSSLSEVAATVE